MDLVRLEKKNLSEESVWRFCIGLLASVACENHSIIRDRLQDMLFQSVNVCFKSVFEGEYSIRQNSADFDYIQIEFIFMFMSKPLEIISHGVRQWQ